MVETIHPVTSLEGSIRLPGDKSISHRYGMLASIAEGTSRIHNYSLGADCQSTLACMRSLGVAMESDGTETTIHGAGLDGLRAAAAPLDAGNSGSTIRMLSGILAAQPFVTRIGGDESLSKRPMARIMKPLGEMGARLEATNEKFPPLTIHGAKLRPIDYALPVASAQVKSCVLFAGVFCEGVTTVREPVPTRDHSEIALRQFGAEVESLGGVITIEGRPKLQGRELTVPGDLSSSAFFLVAALLKKGSSLSIENVGLNPTRSALMDFLVAGGARIRLLNIQQDSGEVVGDIFVEHSPWKGGVLEKAMTAALIDEIPVLAVLGAASEEGLVVRDAAELRVKETDRIATVAENMKRMGITVNVREDGFDVPGKQQFRAAELDSFGDHRIAMAFSVAALAADGPCTIHDAGAASVSFPRFYDTLREISR
ncbi:MAG: 3-phosphoshikimate 1-carboxyvinyltransferase [Acidobacteria bacterium]|nr:3-phosphoshikimate 1-carboxyvinyltransferase [Acidobacteriota bacterium]